MLRKYLVQITLIAAIAIANAAPSNPNATQDTKNLLQYLVSISGKKILSGQESMYGDGTFPSSRDQWADLKSAVNEEKGQMSKGENVAPKNQRLSRLNFLPYQQS